MPVTGEIDWDRYVQANEALSEALQTRTTDAPSLYHRIKKKSGLSTEEEDFLLDHMKDIICANFGMTEWPCARELESSGN